MMKSIIKRVAKKSIIVKPLLTKEMFNDKLRKSLA